MSETKKLLKELNADLFSMRQPSKEHEMFVVGRKKKDPADNKKFTIEYNLKSEPKAAAKAAGIKPQDFIHAAFKPVGAITIGSEGKRSFSGPKKARTSVIFLNTQPDLFNFIKEGVDEGEDKGFSKSGFDAQKRPMIKMRDTVYGLKIGFNVPSYTPHNMNEEGKMKPLTAVSYDPEKGKYLARKVVVGYYEFFADDDDLDKLLEVCARHYDKNIKPYLTERVTTVTEKGGTKLIEVKEEELNQPQGILDDDGNLVDEDGNILKTADELEEEAGK